MNQHFLKRYFLKSLPNFIAIAFGVFLIFICLNISYIQEILFIFVELFKPFIIGFSVAFLLSKPLNFTKEKLYGKTKLSPNLINFFSILTVYSFTALILIATVALVMPQLIISVKSFLQSLPESIQSFQQYVASMEEQTGSIAYYLQKLNISLEQLFAVLTDFLQELIPKLVTFTGSVAKNIYNLIIGIILSVYMCASKDKFKLQFKKLCFALFSKAKAKKIIQVTRYSNHVFTGFIIGKIIDSLIIGILCFILMILFHMPYAILISFIIGVTNVVPFFGPFIGAIPGIFIIATVNIETALWFALLILALQQFDGNILGPFILGDSTGLSSFWVLFSILIFGGLFGFLGMLLGVPTFAVIYTLTKEILATSLKRKQLPLDTDAYEKEPTL